MNFLPLKTPEQNGIVERKNRTLQEMARVMLNSKKLTKKLWAEAINTACYTINKVYLRPGTTKTPYEIWKGREPNRSHFHIFGSTCYILRDREQLGKFDAKSDTGVFLGYSNNSRAYRVYNMRTETFMESSNVVVDDHKDFSEFSKEIEIMSFVDGVSATFSDHDEDEEIHVSETNHIKATTDTVVTVESEQNDRTENPIVTTDDPTPSFDINKQITREPSTRVQNNHPTDLIIGNLNDGMLTRKRLVNFTQYVCFTSLIEPKNIKEALLDTSWVNAMHEELEQYFLEMMCGNWFLDLTILM